MEKKEIYKYDLHTHVKGGSSDSLVTGEDYARLLKEHGYDGMVVTDHYDTYQLRHYHGGRGFCGQNSNFLRGYESCIKPFEEAGLTLLLGLEFSVTYSDGIGRHILLYGVTEEMLRYGNITPILKYDELRLYCKVNDIIMVQAHPERFGPQTIPTSDIDGYEIMNTKESVKSLRDYNADIQSFIKSLSEEERSKLILTGGGDCHEEMDCCSGGIITDTKINTISDLKKVLRSGKYAISKSVMQPL